MLGKQQILVVDDDAEMKLLLCDFLTRQGYNVKTASSGTAALNLLSSLPVDEAPNLVLSDVKMGSMSGIDLTKRILTEHPKLPVVLFSAFWNGELEIEALRSGARRFLRKPFPLGEIARTVNEELKKRG
jgi:DNA-binding NtrC family response regulator